MGWKIWKQNGKKLLNSPTVVDLFYLLTATLLSLLLPLSFLLLARLSTAQYLLTMAPISPQPQPSSFLISFFFYTNPIYLLASLVSVAALVHSLTGRIMAVSRSPGPLSRPRLYVSWVFLCTIQVSVGLGIEGSIAAGVDGSGLGHERGLLSRVTFFLGLHEMMLYWSRTVVKPVVDDTTFGFPREERWVERVAMAASFGTLWWWRLRDEVESLVVMVEVKKELLMGVGVADFVGWWLYYLTVTIGMVRIVKGTLWVGVILLCRRVEVNTEDSIGNEDKV